MSQGAGDPITRLRIVLTGTEDICTVPSGPCDAFVIEGVHPGHVSLDEGLVSGEWSLRLLQPVDNGESCDQVDLGPVEATIFQVATWNNAAYVSGSIDAVPDPQSDGQFDELLGEFWTYDRCGPVDGS